MQGNDAVFDHQTMNGQWDYSQLPATIAVGEGCYLEDRKSFDRVRSTRQPGLVIGDKVFVYCRTSFSIEAGGFVQIGDGSLLGGACFECADRITVGERVVISYDVIIADADFHPRDPIARRQDAIAISPQGDISQRPDFKTCPVRIDDDVQIGIGARILKGVHIGSGAIIQAGAVVTSNVPPGVVVAGNPARITASTHDQQ